MRPRRRAISVLVCLAIIVTKPDPITGKRKLVEVKDMTDIENVKDSLNGQLPATHTYDLNADMIVYVKPSQVADIQAWADLQFPFDVEVRGIPPI